MSAQLENIISAYKTLSKVPFISTAKLNNAGRSINSAWCVRNFDKGRQTKYSVTYTLDDSLNLIGKTDFGIDITNELLSSVSPCETYKALIREEKTGKDSKKQFLEVWDKNTLVHSIDLTALDIHGDVYADAEFGGLEWSPDESAVVYVAEKKLQKYEPYIKRKGEEKPKTDGSGETVAKRGEEYVYKQDWGEQLVGKHLSVIVVCKLETETFTVLEGLPEDWCPGQVSFSPKGDCVVGVAWPTEPRRLGLIFCTNRPCYIFTLKFDGTYKKLSCKGYQARSPRFSPRGDLVWLQRKEGGAHHACHQLVILKDKEITPIIDIVDTCIRIENDELFYGLYSNTLPKRCFNNSGTKLVLNTPQKNKIKSFLVNIDSGEIVDISIDNPEGSTVINDLRNDIVIATHSNLTTPGQLCVGKLDAQMRWLRVTEPVSMPPAVSSATVQLLDFQHPNSKDAVDTFSAIYFAPSIKDKKLPLIVWPHGGPHTVFVNSYAFEPALYAMLGFAVILINYRGSAGCGEASIKCILGNVGDYDVKDCKVATEQAVERFNVDENNLCLYGGSHGGFLVTHLSGQYPDYYRSVVTRNPVTDIASMINSSDIPDWCAVEAGFEFIESGPVCEEQLLKMRRCSPMAHVHKVRAPTAFLLGTVDKRVPNFQSLEFARRLKANGVTTKIYMYDDNHSLSAPAAEMDSFINSAHWFIQHLKQ